MRIATWNVNSIRTRVDRVVDWMQRADVDVLAMQETKCADDQFPAMPFLGAGYEVAHAGVNQWNGVAIASRVGLENVRIGFDGQPSWTKGESASVEARALGATCAGVQVWSLYKTQRAHADRSALSIQAGLACRTARYGPFPGSSTTRPRRSR